LLYKPTTRNEDTITTIINRWNCRGGGEGRKKKRKKEGRGRKRKR
jgi:hypothetical protein